MTDIFEPTERQPTVTPEEPVFWRYGGGEYGGVTYAGLIVDETAPTPGPGLFLAPAVDGVILD